ncbi:cation:dicarboxylate symporter family transporter [Bartonella sp. DGB1]|uniref:cation:dicarboxylate symporter family transporter n=1 Tax=Bartonella sp. DGB1 TaxID=3239807 RepID=UPI003523B998
MNFQFILGLVILILSMLVLFKFLPKSFSLSKRVFTGLVLGIIIGVLLNWYYGSETQVTKQLIGWVDIVAVGYIRLLEMMLMPLVFTSILAAITKLYDNRSIGKIGILTISILLFTTLISAFVGIFLTAIFGLTAAGLTAGPAELQMLKNLATRVEKLDGLTVPDVLLSFIPQNPIVEFSGVNPTSVISVVIIAILFGLAALRLYNDNKELGKKLLISIDILQAWIMKLVQIIISLTPYGVFALVTKMAMTSSLSDIMKLGTFIIVSYLAIFVMFMIHALMLLIIGISPVTYFKKIFPVLSFAFSSRSSAATIPLNIEAQNKRLGVSSSIASFSASIGATIGQNGCAGIYPAMLATMIAPTMGIDVWSPNFFLFLAFIVMISSLGVAGVGGGAIFASLIVLPILGFPITLVALLISIEPLIDMGRTALNVNGSMIAGVVSGRLLGEMNLKTFAKK